MSAISGLGTNKKCDFCLGEQSSKALMRCGACKIALYCNKQCQKNGWPAHKQVCRKANKLFTEKKADDIALRAVLRPAAYAQGAASPEPTASGYLRWMNIWQDALNRGFICGEPRNILILGPGKRGFGNQMHCPQVAEALILAGHGSHFTVLDSNESVLDAVRSIDQEVSRDFIRHTIEQNRAVTLPVEILRRLSLDDTPEHQINIHHFRIGKDQLSDELPPVDMAIATFSLFYQMKDLAASNASKEERIRLLGQYLSKIKPGGAIYVDQDLVIALLATPRDLKNPSMAQRLITEAKLVGLQKLIMDSLELSVEFIHLHQIKGLSIVQGCPIVIQPQMPQGEPESAIQTRDAFAIVVN